MDPLLDDEGDEGEEVEDFRPVGSLDFDPAPLPIAPDGGIEPGAYTDTQRPIQAADPARFVCLRGPCRHYFELAADLDAEAPDGHEPIQVIRACTAVPGVETDLTNQTVRTCTSWEPIGPIVLLRRVAARLFYHLRGKP